MPWPWLAWTIAALLIAARVPCAFTMAVDSDETQHLHVVWNWAQGRVAYRDFTDNHPPLFHVACVPLLNAFGESGATLVRMRLAMIPLFMITVVAAAAIAGTVLRRDVVPWAVALAVALPNGWLRSLEYRADDLWAAASVSAIAVLLCGRFRPRRAWVAGALLGLASAVSLKTAFVLLALACGGLAILFQGGPVSVRARLRAAVAPMGALAAGGIMVPAVVVAWFARQGALDAMWRAIVADNMLPNVGKQGGHGIDPFIFPVAIPMLVLMGRAVVRRTGEPSQASRRAFLIATVGGFYAALQTLWPIVRSQDHLPIHPLVGVLAAAALMAVGESLARRVASPRLGPALRMGPSLLTLATMVALLIVAHPWRDETSSVVRRIDAALRLTDHDEAVFDLKGEFVFRRRAYVPVLEGLTRRRLARGLDEDTVAADLVREGVTVALNDSSKIPPAGRAFMAANFLPGKDAIRVAGSWLETPAGVERRRTFTIAIPADYALLVVSAESGPRRLATGTLDGTPFSGTRHLDPGRHDFIPDGEILTQEHAAVVAARAVSRGFVPDLRGDS